MSGFPAHLTAGSSITSFSLVSHTLIPVSLISTMSKSKKINKLHICSRANILTMNCRRKSSKGKTLKIYWFQVILANIFCKHRLQIAFYNTTYCLQQQQTKTILNHSYRWLYKVNYKTSQSELSDHLIKVRPYIGYKLVEPVNLHKHTGKIISNEEFWPRMTRTAAMKCNHKQLYYLLDHNQAVSPTEVFQAKYQAESLYQTH